VSVCGERPRSLHKQDFVKAAAGGWIRYAMSLEHKQDVPRVSSREVRGFRTGSGSDAAPAQPGVYPMVGAGAGG